MDFGASQRTKAGNVVSGDAYLKLVDGSCLLVAVTDGLGSGEKASRSSRLAIQGTADHSGAALTDIMAYCHYTILAAGGIGTMMAILRLDLAGSSLEFTGVGNIRFLAHSSQVIQPYTRYGYLGVRLPNLQLFRFSYDPGDAFVLHTDGVSSHFHLHNYLPDLARGAQALADRIMEAYGKIYDDATVVVIKT